MNRIFEKKSYDICNEILDVIDNRNVKIEVDENSKSSMYVFFNNTMYLSNKTNNKKSKDEQDKSRLLVIAHECAHSVQAKYLQISNFVFSNLEIITFVLFIVLRLFFDVSTNYIKIGYTFLLLTSIGLRLYLELDATIKSVKIAQRYLNINGIDKEYIKVLSKYYRNELLKTLPAFIAYLFLFKIIRFVIVIML